MKYLLRITGITFGTLALAFLLGWFGAYLDGLRQSEEWANSQSLVDAKLAAYEQAKKDRAAADVCLSTVGESQPVWDEDGNLFCAPKGLRKR